MTPEIVPNTDTSAWCRVLDLAGGESKLAASMGVRPQAVQQWTKNGLPPRRVIGAAAAIGFRVTPHQLDRSLYPYPDDGLPPEHRVQGTLLDQLGEVLTESELRDLVEMIEKGPDAAIGFIRGLAQKHSIPWNDSLIEVGAITRAAGNGPHDTSPREVPPQQTTGGP